jgi:hypothetical protein
MAATAVNAVKHAHEERDIGTWNGFATLGIGLAIIAARQKIVTGAVSMVEMALNDLSAKQVVNLDDERKAAMVSNLMIVLCAESEVQPVINTGTLYQ